MKNLAVCFLFVSTLLVPPAWAGRPQQGDRPVPVLVVEAATGQVGRRVTATGTLYPLSEVKLMSQAEGQVREVLVREGVRVNKGQLLANLDDTIRRIELALARAEMDAERAKLGEAEANAKSREPLYRSGVVSQNEWIKVSAELNRARAEVEKMRQKVNLLRAQLEYFEIRSPINGVITERKMEPGDLAMVRSHMFTLAHVSTLRMRAPVSELELPRLRAGQPALVELDAYPGRRFPGQLTVIFPQIDPRTRQALTEVELPNPDSALRPGLHARVSFEPQMGREAVILPVHAVEWSESNPKEGHVFLLVPIPPRQGSGVPGQSRESRRRGPGRAESPPAPRGAPGEAQAQVQRPGGGQRDEMPQYVARKRKVKIGESVEGRVEIVEGLKPGERVIVSGIGQLKEGAPVRVVTE